ncbi:zinc binding dehydrogenase [Exophiala viscosa]|uniref:Zinc binding dehydrogenase n=1 Tax=Exophiala viscosa TaxID=2486360 RepID=A0AAN6DKU5_9EURO|nr:zinc binding dehydrogenase [Exophiala viscosa]KAI1620140.1 zinc binding dehydrogenase [Exophiala viscosa]
MAPTNHAAWLKAKQDPIMVVEEAPYTSPAEGELVIRTKAVAINPADWHIQDKGMLVTKFPAILGCDVAGEVVEVHPSLANRFAVGDRVFGSANPLFNKDGVYCYSGFQEYMIPKPPQIAKIPEHTTYKDAVVLPLGVNTAASCIFSKEILNLSMPLHSDGGKGKTLLVWGASSSVGACGVQMAALAGYDVVAVASSKNHDMVKGLGAKTCFDQNNTTIVDDLVEHLKGKDVVGAYAAISTPLTIPLCCEVLDKCGGNKVVASVMPGAEAFSSRGVSVQANFVAMHSFVAEGKMTAIWEWLEKALREGRMKCMPPHEVVGHGLGDVQKAVDLMGKGVSGKKLVVVL